MNETVATEDPAPKTEAPTQRLAFDTELADADIPQFLKKSKKSKSGNSGNKDLEREVDEPISVEVSTENEDVKHENIKKGKEVPAPVNETVLQNLAELSIEQLKQQQAELERKISEKQQAERQAVVSQIAQVMDDYNISLEELVESLGGMKFKRRGTKAKAKYRDPVSGVTWSGRGKEPAWIKGVADRTPFEI